MSAKEEYFILPFNFRYFTTEKILLVNISGDFIFLDQQCFDSFLSYQLNETNALYHDLKSKHFLTDTDIVSPVRLLANKLRTKKQFLNSFTSLHMMVITVRCNHDCRYCQVSSVEDDAYKYDMKPETAMAVVDKIFQAPSTTIKIEFQGGEPLLNWETIVAIIEYAENLNKTAHKNLKFVVCTNLTLLNTTKLEYLNSHKVLISTSLDGPKECHDENRLMRNGKSSYDHFVEKLNLTRKILKKSGVGALMTTTSNNLNKLPNVIDEYLRLGFDGIFLRALNPYGLAAENKNRLGYSMDEFVTKYKNALDYIIELNLNGHYFIEFYTLLLLQKILTPFSTGFVDLQSPSGAGISGVIYDYNGDVYPADEARMLNRMGDSYFRMGNVLNDSYEEIFTGKVISELVKKSCVETLPGCFSCAYNIYCGADPVRNYLETKDVIGHRPQSDFCKKHMGIFDVLFDKIKRNNEDEMDVFWSWLTKRSLKEIRCEDNIW